MKRVGLTLTLLIFLSASAWAAISQDEALHLFIKAELVYKDAKYPKAAQLYEQILSGGWASGAVYYNLGNSYFKAENLGKAILNYERARRLIPRDSDLRANLEFANSLLKGPPLGGDRSAVEKILDNFSRLLSRDEILKIFLLLVFLAAVLHLSMLNFPSLRRWGRVGLWVTGALGILLLLNFFMITYRQKGQAVVLGAAQAKFEPREGATSYFELSEGQKVWIINSEGSWRKIRRLDGKIGWVEQQRIEKI